MHPTFDSRGFVHAACAGLDALEFIDRGRQISRALGQHLPSQYPEAIEVLLRSLGPEQPAFFYLPHTQFVAERGLQHFDLSMHAQHALTQRFTAEWSIRPFIAQDPERTFEVLHRWAEDPSPQVRRLASEGTRLRLPWGARVAWLDENPERVLALLERLKDDPDPVVRRSVANNLNDLGKTHAKLLARTAKAWRVGASDARSALLEHALRTAVKRGEPWALTLLGFGQKPSVKLERVRFVPARVKIGQRVAMEFALRSTSARAQDLLVDIAVHFVKAGGKTAPKVFKLKRVSLPGRGEVELKTGFSLAVHTTRVPRPGVHAVDVLVNGVSVPAGSFAVDASPRSHLKTSSRSGSAA